MTNKTYPSAYSSSIGGRPRLRLMAGEPSEDSLSSAQTTDEAFEI